MTDALLDNESTTFGTDLADIRIQIRINPEIWIRNPEHIWLRLMARTEVCALWPRSSCKCCAIEYWSRSIFVSFWQQSYVVGWRRTWRRAPARRRSVLATSLMEDTTFVSLRRLLDQHQETVWSTRSGLHVYNELLDSLVLNRFILLVFLDMCENDFRVPISSHSHDFVPIPIPGLGKS